MKINKKHVKKGAEISARAAGGLLHLVLKLVGTIVLVLILTAVIFAIIFGSYVKNALSDEVGVSLSDFSLAQTSVIYYWDDTSQSYQVLDTLSGREKRTWISYENIPKHMEHAAVAIEDKRFYSHHGVDWYRTAGAFGSMFLSMSNTYGGSTITQQLIKNLTEYDEVTVKRKLFEIFSALDFERRYSKEEIMEWYLNKIYFGEGCFGIAAAADEYFGKTVDELTIAECACIIGITNNPSMYDPYINEKLNKERQETILFEMYDQEYITEAEYKEAMAQELVFQRGSDLEEEGEESSDVTSWFVDALIEDIIADLMEEKNVSYDIAEDLLYSAGYKIYATIDKDIQNIVDEVYSDRSNLPSGYRQSTYQLLESAMVIVEPYSGNIVALAGRMGEKEGSRVYNFATDMQRSPGSTIKPIASYSLAMDLGLIMPYTTFYDSNAVTLSGSDWYPSNDNAKNEGQITIRYALQRSINTVAAQLVDLLGPETSYNFLTEKLGFTSLVGEGENNDKGYASMALGELTYGATVREMASAYTCFVNDGIWTEGRLYTHITDSQDNLVYENIPDSTVALSSTTAYYMTNLMQNAVNAGSAYTAKFGDMPIAGKTGGSSGWRDRWFIGYTPYYIAAVWSGYEHPETMGSSNPSTGMWKQVMERVHANLPTTSFGIPEGMRQVTVCIDSGLRASDACSKDIRGSRTMTLYMEDNKIPAQTCNCHVLVELCSESYGFDCGNCPQDSIKTYAVLDTSKAETPINTFPYYEDEACYIADDAEAVEDQRISYTLDEMQICHMHAKDEVSGWYLNTETGFLVNPVNGLIYDPAEDKLYDKYSGWQIDWKTGALIDPVSGELIDPWTGESYIPNGTIDENSPDKYDRPPGYGPNSSGNSGTDNGSTDDGNTGEGDNGGTTTPDPGDIIPGSPNDLFYNP